MPAGGFAREAPLPCSRQLVEWDRSCLAGCGSLPYLLRPADHWRSGSHRCRIEIRELQSDVQRAPLRKGRCTARGVPANLCEQTVADAGDSGPIEAGGVRALGGEFAGGFAPEFRDHTDASTALADGRNPLALLAAGGPFAACPGGREVYSEGLGDVDGAPGQLPERGPEFAS